MIAYRIQNDIELVRELSGLTIQEIADLTGVSRMTISRWMCGQEHISYEKLDAFYQMAYKYGIRLNRIKEQFYMEEHVSKTAKVLFHGSKKGIEGVIHLSVSRESNDFGQGFYCGENLSQSAMFIAGYPKSVLYMLAFDRSGLKSKEYAIDQDWILAIAYFRGKLSEYMSSRTIIKLADSLKGIDYIIAPIADNRMFEIIDSFINGEITDVHCQHCLSATNLGNQYVFLSQRAAERIDILEPCFLCPDEKKYYLNEGQEYIHMNADKVKIARKKYRGKGKYIEEILL